LSVKAHVCGFGIALLLFGPFFLVTGYLIFKSGYFPKAIGILYLLPGLSYLINGFGLILAPATQIGYSPSLPALRLLGRHHSAFGFL